METLYFISRHYYIAQDWPEIRVFRSGFFPQFFIGTCSKQKNASLSNKAWKGRRGDREKYQKYVAKEFETFREVFECQSKDINEIKITETGIFLLFPLIASSKNLFYCDKWLKWLRFSATKNLIYFFPRFSKSFMISLIGFDRDLSCKRDSWISFSWRETFIWSTSMFLWRRICLSS